MSSSKVSDSQTAEMLGNQSSEPGVNQSVENQAEAGVQVYTVADVQELIQHVQWLQLQLKQVENQEGQLLRSNVSILLLSINIRRVTRKFLASAIM